MQKPQSYSNLLYHTLTDFNTNDVYKDLIIQREGIKVLTYNFFLRPPPIKNNIDDFKEERLQDFKTKFNEFDIICFQEMFGSFHQRKEKMIKNAAECGFFYHCKSPLPSFFSKYLIDAGLLIVSRFPIIESKFEAFDYGALSDSLSGKGVLYAKIKVKNMFIGLFATHLQASYFDITESMWKYTINTRIEQSEYLINIIYNKIYQWNKSERNRTTFILAGDFNIDYYDNRTQREKMNLPESSIDEYSVFKSKLNMLGKAIDLSQMKYKEQIPFTFGVNDEGNDQVLTHPCDFNSRQTLDYIWEIIPNYSLIIYGEPDTSYNDFDSVPNNSLKVDYNSFKVEEFKISNRPYQQLSDHFGLSFTMEKPII